MSVVPTLYYMPGSCALSCHIALEWSGAEYATKRLAREDLSSGDFLAINPKAKVPALALGDGRTVTEALAVLAHIAESRPDAPGLMPEGPARGEMLEALSELTGEFHPAFFPIHVPQRYTIDPDGHDGVRAAARKRVRGHYDRWNERMAGSDWTVAGGRSVADAYLYVMCRWAGIVDAEIAEWSHLARFAARMGGDDGVRAALAAEGLELPAPASA